MVDKIYWIGGFVICGLALLYKYYRDKSVGHGTTLEDRNPPSVQESNPNRRVLKITGPLVWH